MCHGVIFDALQYADEFANKFRPITVQVSISNEIPSAGLEIPSIGDDDIASNLEGFHLSRSDMEVCIAGLFPNAPPINFCDNIGPRNFEIGFETELSKDLAEGIQAFVEPHLRGLSVAITIRRPEPKVEMSKQVRSMTANDFKPFRQRLGVPQFVKEEEEWWFGNLDRIARGYVTPRSFSITEDAGMACYIHGTAFPQIDLRQALLAFDTIYLEPPLCEDENLSGLPSFWTSQSINRDDLLRLIEKDRVRLIHSQPEERGDLGLLREAREANPKGVIGRRMTAALMFSDIVETANEYRLSQDDLESDVLELIKRLADIHKAPLGEVARSVLCPNYMRRLAVENLTRQGTMGSTSFDQGRLFGEVIQRVRGKEVLIESYMFGQCIQTAHTLNATYIPHTPHDSYVESWINPMALMGDRLNFYRSMSTRLTAAWATNQRGIESRRIVLPPIPLFDFDRSAPIDDILLFTSRPSIRRKGRSLVARVSELPEEERASEMSRLQKKLYELGVKNERREMSTSFLDASLTLADYAASTALFPFTAGWTMLKAMIHAARRSPSLDRFLDSLEADLSRPGNDDLHFLSKISRVAKIKQ